MQSIKITEASVTFCFHIVSTLENSWNREFGLEGASCDGFVFNFVSLSFYHLYNRGSVSICLFYVWVRSSSLLVYKTLSNAQGLCYLRILLSCAL